MSKPCSAPPGDAAVPGAGHDYGQPGNGTQHYSIYERTGHAHEALTHRVVGFGGRGGDGAEPRPASFENTPRPIPRRMAVFTVRPAIAPAAASALKALRTIKLSPGYGGQIEYKSEQRKYQIRRRHQRHDHLRYLGQSAHSAEQYGRRAYRNEDSSNDQRPRYPHGMHPPSPVLQASANRGKGSARRPQCRLSA